MELTNGTLHLVISIKVSLGDSLLSKTTSFMPEDSLDKNLQKLEEDLECPQ